MAKTIKGKGFRQALTIRQVGAVRSGSLFKLGGGLFTKQEILKSRLRKGKRMGAKHLKKSAVGL